MCALGALITITSYLCLNTAQYIHVVEYSECFNNGYSRVLEKFVRISGVHVHMGIRCSKQLVLTEELFTDGVELPSSEYTYFHISCIEYL